MSPPPPQRGRHSPPALDDDSMSEIFLRIPPDDPKSLVRAAAVCPTWHRILSDAAFARGYRAFHRAPPMLGFLHNKRHERPWGRGWRRRHEEYLVSNFVSTASFRPPACHERRHWPAIDSRHGLVLFHTPKRCEDFVICDLVTYDRWRIKADPACRRIIWNGRFDEDWGEYDDEDEDVTWNAAVLCAKDGCDHLYCHGGPFLVALVGSVRGRQMTFASVYSSATRKWSGMISVKEPNVIEMTGHNAVVVNKVYFPCEQSDSVLEYDMGEQKLSVIRAPFAGLVGAEGGLLVFATVLKPRLHIWLMEVRVRPDRTTALARRRSIELAPKLSAYALLDVSVVGFAEGVGVIFLSTKAGLYTVELSSGRIKSMDREPSLGKIMPYMCFYTREWGRLPTSD
ncbi:unnamed protein product [Triticum turgidum subsp. durum]|uniref:F-box domain-containing protein n=1 Tax=Triticum turgidum subsp. durum TaxID=4567 RepID=A0A9R0S2M1_TRITD|nr:unnamed protein product [Triticum turgidum subsp. durum]